MNDEVSRAERLLVFYFFSLESLTYNIVFVYCQVVFHHSDVFLLNMLICLCNICLVLTSHNNNDLLLRDSGDSVELNPY